MQCQSSPQGPHQFLCPCHSLLTFQTIHCQGVCNKARVHTMLGGNSIVCFTSSVAASIARVHITQGGGRMRKVTPCSYSGKVRYAAFLSSCYTVQERHDSSCGPLLQRQKAKSAYRRVWQQDCLLAGPAGEAGSTAMAEPASMQHITSSRVIQ